MENVNLTVDQLYGLGAAVMLQKLQAAIPASAMPIAQAAVTAAKNAGMAEKYLSKGAAFMQMKAAKLDPDTIKKWQDGELQFNDGVFYARKIISLASGNVEIFSDALLKVDGVSNISKGKLADGINLALERLELNFDRGTGITEKTAALTALVVSDDPALRNGVIELRINGKTVREIPVNQFNKARKVGDPLNGYDFKHPILVKAGDDIQIVVHFVGTMVTSTDVDVIEFVLIGDATGLRVNG